MGSGRRRRFELSDPATGRRLQLSELGYSVAWLMDGRDLFSLAARVARDLRVDVPIEHLARFVRRLAQRGWLECGRWARDTVPESVLTTRALTQDELAALLPDAGLPRSSVHPRVRRGRSPSAPPARPAPDTTGSIHTESTAIVRFRSISARR